VLALRGSLCGQVHLMRFYEDFFSALGLVRDGGGASHKCVGCRSASVIYRLSGLCLFSTAVFILHVLVVPVFRLWGTLNIERRFSWCAGPQPCAQVLLTLDNLAQRGQYLNASNTFRELFAYGTVPVVNENDTVAVEELRIGDNDTLSAQARLAAVHDRPHSWLCCSELQCNGSVGNPQASAWT